MSVRTVHACTPRMMAAEFHRWAIVFLIGCLVVHGHAVDDASDAALVSQTRNKRSPVDVSPKSGDDVARPIQNNPDVVHSLLDSMDDSDWTDMDTVNNDRSNYPRYYNEPVHVTRKRQDADPTDTLDPQQLRLRFGRSGVRLRFGRSDPPMLRFGRGDPPMLRFGRGDPPMLRFGRGDPPMLRFGRPDPLMLRFGREPHMLRFGRGDPVMLRFGRDPVVLRFGK